jgi:hypothetical protein
MDRTCSSGVPADMPTGPPVSANLIGKKISHACWNCWAGAEWESYKARHQARPPSRKFLPEETADGALSA